MKKMKAFFLLFIATIFYSVAFGQNQLLDGVPQTKEEFISSEKKVIATINWLETTPLNQEPEKRKMQNALLIAWLTNSPTVTLEINADILTFTKKNNDLLVFFMGGWTRYCLENNYSTDAVKGNLAGIRSAMNVYKTGIAIKKDKAMDKLIEMENKGELEKWVSERLGKK